MFRISTVATFLVATLLIAPARAQEVDLQLVLAADRSGSIAPAYRRAQRLGFAAAFRDPSLQRAILGGPTGKVAVVYYEWSSETDQEVIVPWMILASTEDMARFATMLEAKPISPFGGDTSISGAMYFASQILQECGCDAWRRVVDISSNGRNNSGPALSQALAHLRKQDVTVNGLILPPAPLDHKGPYASLFTRYEGPIEPYYEKLVIGGPGAFVISVDFEDGFEEAILRKLVLEVAMAETPRGRM